MSASHGFASCGTPCGTTTTVRRIDTERLDDGRCTYPTVRSRPPPERTDRGIMTSRYRRRPRPKYSGYRRYCRSCTVNTIGRRPISGVVPPPWWTTSADRVLAASHECSARTGVDRRSRRERNGDDAKPCSELAVCGTKRPLAVDRRLDRVALGQPVQLPNEVLLRPSDSTRGDPGQVDGDTQHAALTPPPPGTPPAVASAAADPRAIGAARASASRRPRIRVGERRLQAAGDRLDIERIDQHRRPTGDLFGRATSAGDHRSPLGHRLDHRQSEPFLQTGVGEHRGSAVQRCQIGHLARTPGTGSRFRALRERHPTRRRTDDDQCHRLVEPVHRRRQPIEVLARFDRSDEQHESSPEDRRSA